MDATSFTIDASALGVGVRPTEFASTKTSSEVYDAIEDRGKRKRPVARVVREDVNLRGKKRTQLIANANDVARNFSIACWAIRRHLDYVTQFDFQMQTGDREFDKKVEALIEKRSRRDVFDRGGRLTREKAFRLMEGRALLDNDIGMMRLRDGSIQIIESDLIKNPPKPDERSGTENVDGVRKDYAGWHLGYHIWGRDAGGVNTSYRREVPRSNFHLYGFFDRAASDQVRGISPFVTAINPLRDTYDVFDLATAKMKLGEILGVAITKKMENGSLGNSMAGQDREDQDGCDEDEEEPQELDVSPGVKIWQLDENEGIETVESKAATANVREMLMQLVAVALKALDIPYSFFDESFTNYSGSRGSWLHYERSCWDKRLNQREMRDLWTLWQLVTMIAVTGELVLPGAMTLEDLTWQWVPRGMPWWKPSEEVVGDIKAVGAAFDNPERICRERDRGDVYDNIDATLRVMKYAQEQGMKMIGKPLELSFTAEFPQTIEVSANGN